MTAEQLRQIEEEHRAIMLHYGFGPEIMRRKKVCPRCHTVQAAAGYFCINCGQRLEKGTLYDLYRRMHPYCPRCDTVAADDAEFCSICGTPLANRKSWRTVARWNTRWTGHRQK